MKCQIVNVEDIGLKLVLKCQVIMKFYFENIFEK